MRTRSKIRWQVIVGFIGLLFAIALYEYQKARTKDSSTSVHIENKIDPITQEELNRIREQYEEMRRRMAETKPVTPLQVPPPEIPKLPASSNESELETLLKDLKAKMALLLNRQGETLSLIKGHLKILQQNQQVSKEVVATFGVVKALEKRIAEKGMAVPRKEYDSAKVTEDLRNDLKEWITQCRKVDEFYQHIVADRGTEETLNALLTENKIEKQEFKQMMEQRKRQVAEARTAKDDAAKLQREFESLLKAVTQ